MDHPLPFSNLEKVRYWKERAERDRASTERRAIEKERLKSYFREYRTAAARLFTVIRNAAQEYGGKKTAESSKRILKVADEFRRADPFFAGLDEPEGFWQFYDIIVDRLNLCYVEVVPGNSRARPLPRLLMLSERAVARVWTSLARDLAKLDDVDVDLLVARMRSSLRHAVVQYGYWEILPFEPKAFSSIAGIRQRIGCFQIHTGFSPPSMDDARADIGALLSSLFKGGPNGAFRRFSSRRDLSFSYDRRIAARGLYCSPSQSQIAGRGPRISNDRFVCRSSARTG